MDLFKETGENSRKTSDARPYLTPINGISAFTKFFFLLKDKKNISKALKLIILLLNNLNNLLTVFCIHELFFERVILQYL